MVLATGAVCLKVKHKLEYGSHARYIEICSIALIKSYYPEATTLGLFLSNKVPWLSNHPYTLSREEDPEEYRNLLSALIYVHGQVVRCPNELSEAQTSQSEVVLLSNISALLT